MPSWRVELHPDFVAELDALPTDVQDELFAMVGLLEEWGPRLARPHVDTLKGSVHANMKELRFRVAGGAWRVTFAFDPQRKAILLVAGNKAGVAERKFYRKLIDRSDARFTEHLRRLEGA